MTQQQTYGIYSVQPRGISLKDDRDNGWVADIKWAFTTGAKPERKLELEHLSVLKGASASDGVRLELTPRIDGTHLEPVMLGVTQRGNITIGEEGEVLCTTRITLDALETAGLGIDAILAAKQLPGVHRQRAAHPRREREGAGGAGRGGCSAAGR